MWLEGMLVAAFVIIIIQINEYIACKRQVVELKELLAKREDYAELLCQSNEEREKMKDIITLLAKDINESISQSLELELMAKEIKELNFVLFNVNMAYQKLKDESAKNECISKGSKPKSKPKSKSQSKSKRKAS